MGFIGAWTVYLFKLNGWKVYGIDDRSSYGERLYDKANLSSLVDKEIDCDVANLEKWQMWLSEIQPALIIHLAGQAIVPRAFKQPYLTYRTNTLGTLAVLEAAKITESVSAVVCITSDKVYENNNNGLAFSESDLLGGSDIYSISKSSSELICKAYYKTHLIERNISIQTVRLGNVVGGGDWSINRLVPDLYSAALKNTTFKVRYIEATRPFQHVSDVAIGIYRIANAASNGAIKSGEAWNLGPKDNSFATVRSVIDLFKQYYPGLIIIDENEKIKEDMNLSVNIEKYCKNFPEPRDNSESALKRTINWYQNYILSGNPNKLMEKDLM
jgi:CDP-glucose 4,6-dehydratase